MCYHCKEKFDSLSVTKEHLESTHSDKPLKFRQITVNETTGERVLVSKQFRNAAASSLKLETDAPKSERSELEEEDAFLQTAARAAARLKEQGLLSEWIALHDIIADIPLDNIALLLFLDVVTFYSTKKTVGMRYASQTRKFWQNCLQAWWWEATAIHG